MEGSTQLIQPFNPQGIDPSQFPPPPTLADYHVHVETAEIAETTDKLSGMVVANLRILDPGQFFGQLIPYRINLYNKDEKTRGIAQRQMAALLHVTGLGTTVVSDLRQLYGIPFMANIGPQKDNPQYANVFRVMFIDGRMPGAGPATPAESAFATPAPAAAPAQPAPAVWGGGNPAPAAQPAPGPVTWQPAPAAAPAPATSAPATWSPQPTGAAPVTDTRPAWAR